MALIYKIILIFLPYVSIQQMVKLLLYLIMEYITKIKYVYLSNTLSSNLVYGTISVVTIYRIFS